VDVVPNCVLVSGRNTREEAIQAYVATANAFGFQRIRFLVSEASGAAAGERVVRALGLRKPSRKRHGRVLEYLQTEGRAIELVECDQTQDTKLGRCDLYVGTRSSVKIGLTGSERFFSTTEELDGILSQIGL
jgi:hypothetical protein